MANGNGNGNGEETKQMIVDLLNSRPVGLTIRDIAKSLDIHRQTIAKYVLVLDAEGKIHRRVIGSATIHYPKATYDKRMGGISKVSKKAGI